VNVESPLGFEMDIAPTDGAGGINVHDVELASCEGVSVPVFEAESVGQAGVVDCVEEFFWTFFGENGSTQTFPEELHTEGVGGGEGGELGVES